MSREIQVLVWCDFAHETPTPGNEVVMSVGEGKPPKAVGACDACEAKYLAPIAVAYAAGADVGPIAPPTAKPAEPAPRPTRTEAERERKRASDQRPAPVPGGNCHIEGCESVSGNYNSWTQHMHARHGWAGPQRREWLLEHAPEFAPAQTGRGAVKAA